ncbi:MAG: type II toxin-antitoxin system RelE/ParE family toxin [Thermomicrobiales bacterium]
MPTFAVQLYESSFGERPFADFLRGLQPKERRKCTDYMGRLATDGFQIPHGYMEKVEDDMWTLRPEWNNNEFRLFFTLHKGTFVFVHGINKKRDKLPRSDVELARRRIKEWKERS